MGLETRLVRRKNGTYSFRAWVPQSCVRWSKVAEADRNGSLWEPLIVQRQCAVHA